MIDQAGFRVHLLMQGSAERDVHFLQAAADAEQGRAGADGGWHQRHGQRVAPRIEPVGGRWERRTRGFDVRGRSGQQHPIDLRQQVDGIGGPAIGNNTGCRPSAVTAAA